jgi:uncharacterized protein YigA (DUF484 family)
MSNVEKQLDSATLNVTPESDSEVADYLVRNPDFLTRHPEILESMAVPERWSGDGVVDMQRYMLDRRCEEIDELRNCAIDVIETSRSNMSTQTRTHAAVLAVIAAGNMETLVHVVTQDWPMLLDVDVVSLAFEPVAGRLVVAVGQDIRSLPIGSIDALIGADQDVCLARRVPDNGDVFGAGAGLVRSAAYVRLSPAEDMPPGMLALGSRGNAFQSGQGAELLIFLSRVVESCLYRCLDLDR